MLKVFFIKNHRGQSLLDYLILIGIVASALFAMNTSFRRGIQAVIKGAADQIGDQAKSEQDFEGRSGYLEASQSTVDTSNHREVEDRFGSNTYRMNSSEDSTSSSVINAGFTETYD